MEARETGPISIHVQSDNAILFNKSKIKVEELAALLKQAKKNYPNARPQLFHDKRAQFGTYQSVKNAVGRSRLSANGHHLKTRVMGVLNWNK